MNKRILLTAFLLLTLLFSVSAISASDVNVTDSYEAGLDDASNAEDIVQSEDADSTNDVYSAVALQDTIKASNVTKYYKGSTNYTATFTDIDGKALENATVKLIIDDITKNIETDVNGVVSLDIDLTPGTYDITATNPSTNYNLTTLFKILPTIKANDLTKIYKDGKMFTATFLNSDGAVLANQDIRFSIVGKNYTVRTDDNGVASLSLVNLKAGTYILASSNADGLTVNATVKVLSSSATKLNTASYTFPKKNTKQIKVRLLNSLGYGVSGKVVKITINGKTYSKKTDGNGYAVFKLPNLNTGIYGVKYSFSGDSVYKASSASNKVSIVLSAKNKVVTIKNILEKASKLRSFYDKKGYVPDTVKAGGYTFTIHEFYYLMNKALCLLSKSKNTQITALSVKGPAYKFTNGVYSAAVVKSKYKVIAKKNVNYIKKHKRVPAHISAVAGKIAYEDYVFLTARALDYFYKHNEAPNFIAFISHHKPTYKFFTKGKDANQFGLKGKKVWIDADGGSDAIKWQLASALRKLGWEVHVGDTYANAHYEDYHNVYPGYVLITIYNGFCAGTIRELASDWVQDLLDTKNVVCVPVFHTAGWTNPQGMAPYRYGDFSGYSAKKAWDDNFSVKDPSISNVGQFLKKNNIKYCASPTVNLIVNQFLKGGYFASVS